MNSGKPNELKTLSIDVTVDGDNAMLLDWGNMETVNIPKEDWQQIKEHIDKWFEQKFSDFDDDYTCFEFSWSDL